MIVCVRERECVCGGGRESSRESDETERERLGKKKNGRVNIYKEIKR